LTKHLKDYFVKTGSQTGWLYQDRLNRKDLDQILDIGLLASQWKHEDTYECPKLLLLESLREKQLHFLTKEQQIQRLRLYRYALFAVDHYN
jgi:hypothetical protein